MRGVGHSLRAVEIQELSVRGTFQDVYKPFYLKVPIQQVCVGGKDLQVVSIISRI